ncbi:DUF676-domain-containing protein [Violaceomyces palustris]|uniref:DUF676-domain-containing protein n=1 Tax=Violaceomyces palustris TaxID=1673888 RepID=A0ACD0NSF3_9BASI|nr:DUF676-domain-containing protein [Violaceomyces palustris]
MPVHLVVICHGLWGAPEHTSYLATTLAKQHKGSVSPSSVLAPPESPATVNVHSDPGLSEHDTIPRLVVLNSNANRDDHTYDGIDWCGERIVKEIYQEVARIEKEEGSLVSRFSIIGYSLGGLIARYVIGLLYSQGFFSTDSSGTSTPSSFPSPNITFQSRPKAVSLTTLATPHIGLPPSSSGFKKLVAYIGGRMIGRTGRQLYGIDSGWHVDDLNDHPPDAEPTSNEPDQDQKFTSLLEAMTEPTSSFWKALQLFERIDVYANAIADVTVPYRTGAIEEHDPFIVKGGLELIRDPDHPELLKSFKAVEALPPRPPLATRLLHSLSPNNLPWLLNPARFPFPFPLNYLAFVSLPILLPVLVTLVLHKFSTQSRLSDKRVAEFEKAWAIEWAGKNGIDRSSIEALLAEDEQDVGRKGRGKRGKKADALDPEVRNKVERSRIAQLLKLAEEQAEQIVREAGEENVEQIVKGSGLSTDASHLNGNGLEDQHETKPAVTSANPGENPATLSLSDSYILDPEETPLTPTQALMAKRLNSLPQLKKHLAHFENIINTHAVIVVRSTGIESHRRGMGVVKALAERFQV